MKNRNEDNVVFTIIQVIFKLFVVYLLHKNFFNYANFYSKILFLNNKQGIIVKRLLYSRN